MPSLEPRALIFDMDGLLIDSEPLWWSVEKAFGARHDIHWSDELAESCVGTGLSNVIATMRRELGLELAVADGVACLIDDFVARRSELRLKRGARELLEAARDLPLALATSNERRVAEAVVAELDLSAAFDAIVTASDVVRSKPAPDIFLLAAERLGVPKGGVVLEDSLAGIAAARAAGLLAIAVPERHPERFADLTPYVVADLCEARALLGLAGC